MADPGVRIVEQPIRRSDLAMLAEQQFGDMVKAVVDVSRRIMAVGGELHSDEESVLLESGSRQADLWGLNLHVEEPREQWIEFDSMINLRPSQGNRSPRVDDPGLRQRISEIVDSLVTD